jgi:signal transduction histidine kinase
MGEMASEIAHQIRNPLGGIELFASILAREVEGDPSLGPLVEHVISGVGQVNHLITNYLALASTTRPARKPVSLSLAAGEALGAAAAAMDQAGIAVEVKGGGLGAMVDADPQLLMQVFLNIILNAVEAMESGGKLTVRLKSGRRRAEAVFTDTGPGIAPERLDRIFNPFYTTKNKNLGLGLAVSHRIVDAHNGSIQVGGRPGRGAAVTVSLPLAGGGSWGRGKDGS